MNILQIVPYFFLKFGSGSGTVDLVHEISSNLVLNGHDVTIYTTNIFNKNEYSNTKIHIIDEIKVYEFNSHGKYPFIFSLDMIKQVSKSISDFDIVHIHEYRNFQNNIVHHYSKKHNIPYIIEAHGSLSTNIGRSNFKKIYDNIFGKRILKNASRVIAITQDEAKQYKSIGLNQEKITIIPNGIEFSNYQNLPTKGFFRKNYQISTDDKLIIYLGRLDETKGIDLLLKSFKKAILEIPNIKLAILGRDTPYKNKLIKLIDQLNINEHVLFTGFFGMEEKISALVDSDLFVTPSYNGFPHSFLESCACGTPIITTDTGDFLKWIDGNVGLVTEYNENSLKDAIVGILNDDNLRKKFSDNCRKLIKKRFDWPIIIKELETAYLKAIEMNKEKIR